jgi:hypothetical protein
VVADGSTLRISASASYVDRTAMAHGCTADCTMLSGMCPTGYLPSGSYTLVFGVSTLSLTIPSEAPIPPCITN